jgi:hypothetical protein
MLYRGPDDDTGRELKRLWEVEVYVGDPDASEVETRKHTIIAWNHVDAIRHTGGKPVVMPKALFFVTHPDEQGRIFRINDTSEGSIGEPINPSIAPPEIEDEDWQ